MSQMTLSDLSNSLSTTSDLYANEPIGEGVKFRTRNGKFVVMYPEHFKLFLEFQKLIHSKKVIKVDVNANY